MCSSDLVSVNLKGYTLAIVKPPIHVSTADAYQQLKPATDFEPGRSLGLTEPVSKWRRCLINDFEESVFKEYPAIAEIKNQLYQLGAVYASMSGSGSSVYGLFESQIGIEKEFPNDICWTGMLS